MIDTHAHLETLCDVDKGIDKIILAASNIDDSQNNLLLGEKYPEKLLIGVGIHPQECDASPAELKKLIEENYEKITAIGECGLEFLGDYDRKKQEKVFRDQIELAQQFDKPLIIHARKAVDETLEILKEYKNISGVFHCYAGGNKRIKKILDLGKDWYFGIDGNLTYEEGLVDVVKNIPKDRLVLETDSPFLTPEPFRGQENNPNNIVYVYKKVAEIWAKSFEETEEIIDENAKKLFKFI
ncbi:MAG: TatD family hydrolase [Candidatus Shapirobacteria bacterium]|nr:TatD family hydrolase [Candidatus Shapirobacteria bacterium]